MVPNCNQSLTVLVGACAARPPACGNATPNSPQRKIVPLFCAKMLCDCFKRKRVFFGSKNTISFLFSPLLRPVWSLFIPLYGQFAKGDWVPPKFATYFFGKNLVCKGGGLSPLHTSSTNKYLRLSLIGQIVVLNSIRNFLCYINIIVSLSYIPVTLHTTLQQAEETL